MINRNTQLKFTLKEKILNQLLILKKLKTKESQKITNQ